MYCCDYVLFRSILEGYFLIGGQFLAIFLAIKKFFLGVDQCWPNPWLWEKRNLLAGLDWIILVKSFIPYVAVLKGLIFNRPSLAGAILQLLLLLID